MSGANERLETLLTLRATEGLDTAAERELEMLLAASPGTDADAFDRAAAAVHLAALGPRELLPGTLRVRLEESAVAALRARR